MLSNMLTDVHLHLQIMLRNIPNKIDQATLQGKDAIVSMETRKS